MKKHLKITSIFLISMLLVSCGFKKINTPDSRNFKIENITISGDNRIGHLLKNEIRLNSAENSTNQININLIISKNKDTKEKSISGRIKKYTLELKVNLTINEINSSKIIKKNFTKSVDFDVMGNHSDTIDLERRTIVRATETVSGDIINFLIINYRSM